jgi:hypothetical protein
MNNIKAFFVLLFIGSCLSAIAQQSILPANDTELIKGTIIELFDGYRAGDSLRVKNTFTSSATFQTAFFDKEGNSQLSAPSPVAKFVAYIGGGFEKEHDERLWDIEVRIDNNLATVWTKYAFYLADEFSHCGAENFLLIKQEDGAWKIFHLVDT